MAAYTPGRIAKLASQQVRQSGNMLSTGAGQMVQTPEIRTPRIDMLHQNKNIFDTLRFASAMCFFGHGAFGFIGKKIWLNYFAVFGVGSALGNHLMPVVGTVDILMGISLLIYPTRAVLGWLAVWGAVTALCRPLSGEPFAEFIERAGNYCAPLALLLLCQANLLHVRKWFRPLEANTNESLKTRENVLLCLRVAVFLLFVGHGWLNLIEKKGLLAQYTALGFSNPVNVADIVGVAELIAAVSVLIKPVRPLLFAFLIWKMGSELFYPHWELFEWIERGGSYGVILALWFTLPKSGIVIKRKPLTSSTN
jgi:uncharacterized membrane protein YphA (DoxX/SURF4 family)